MFLKNLENQNIGNFNISYLTNKIFLINNLSLKKRTFVRTSDSFKKHGITRGN
jgi:hypothetical protein